MTELAAPSIFSKLSASFTRNFGGDVVFSTGSGDHTLRSIVREEADIFNEDGGGVGTQGKVAYVRVSTVDAALLAEGDTLIYQTVTFKIAGPGAPDGRGMTGFDLVRVV